MTPQPTLLYDSCVAEMSSEKTMESENITHLGSNAINFEHRRKIEVLGLHKIFQPSYLLHHEPPFKRVVCSRPIRPRFTGSA